MGNMITGIISLSVGAVLLASVFITSVKNVNQTYTDPVTGNGTLTWTTGETAMWGLLTLIGIVGMVYGVLNVFGLA